MKTKTVFKGFDYLHCDSFADYLSQMAAKGWHFKAWQTGLVFEKGEPSQDVYAVEVFWEGSEYDTRPEPNTKEFAEYCEAAGWKLVDAKRKFCIFKRTKDDAQPILTPEERLNAIAKAEIKNHMPQLFLAVWGFALQCLQFAGARGAFRFFSNDLLFVLVLWFVLLAFGIGKLIFLIGWKSSRRNKLKRGEGISFGKPNEVRTKFDTWFTVALAIFILGAYLLMGQYNMVLFYIAFTAIIVIFGAIISKIRPDNSTHVLLQIVFSVAVVFGFTLFIIVGFVKGNEKELTAADVPLLYEDIGGEAGELQHVYSDKDQSIFGSMEKDILSYEDESILYYVYKSEQAWLLDKIWEDAAKTAKTENSDDCTEQWQAKIALRAPTGHYYVRYENAVLVLSFAKETHLTDEQISVIREKLEV